VREKHAPRLSSRLSRGLSSISSFENAGKRKNVLKREKKKSIRINVIRLVVKGFYYNRGNNFITSVSVYIF